MILSAQSIRQRCSKNHSGMINPFHERTELHGLTYGLSSAGYDIRLMGGMWLRRGRFALACSVEKFNMPNDVLARVTDKSTWARMGLMVGNTVIEPGWRWHLTLELSNRGDDDLLIEPESPIAQVIFEQLDEATEQPYCGRYQDQEDMPVEARLIK